MDQIAFSNQIAIVGMNGRFPGARTIHEFWENLRGGVEGISFFTDQELQASGIDPALYGRSNYVKAGAVLDDIEMFDAAFFGISAREAALMDPQQRFFLECAWEVLEHAGYDPERYRKRIGVFAGASMDTYLLSNVVRNREVMEEEGVFQIGLGNEKDYLATRISYKLNLRGPGISISTACSTSLVAVHMAVQSLLNNECDMALAGGVAINVPHKMGYLYQEGGIVSPDGHCRAFDEHAQGTIRGNGVGVVLLKRFTDAVKDNDTIYAVIKGSAVNNDGSAKVGFTAPSIQGQARAIAEAQAVADIQPEQVTYIEAHGTGTELGDPIEIEALKRVFRTRTQKQGFCAIGSVKTNIGHLDAAAGITGLIKTVLALTHKQIPPSLHFVRPNARIDFTNSPFYVNIQLSAWESNGTPRTAGVSSFGIGGTNAHVIVQEAPSIAPSVQETKPYYLLTLSARTETALAAMTRNLAEHLKQHPDAQMANVAYVLQSGRKQFAMRRTVLCQKREEAIQALEMLDAEHVVTGEVISPQPSVIFLFPGQGAQHLHMAFELYQHEPVFHKHLERCMDALQPHLKRDLRAIVYPRADEAEEARHELTQTALAQPALFALEYALAQMWMEWGVRPQALIGHSIGEYVAATLAGVFALEDAARLVVLRGEMMQAVPRGAMLAVSLSPADLQPFLHEQLSLAAINSPTRCVVAGTTEAIETLSGVLVAKGIVVRTLHTSHAFHSSMMDSLIKPFAAEVKKIQRTAPTLPFVSNVTGTWISAAEATDPDYWSMHLRQTVQFATGLQTLLNEPQRIFLEVGPGSTLSALAKQHPARKSTQRILTSLPHVREQSSDLMHVLQTLGHLWVDGIQIEWTRFASEGLQRIPLPTYPFERQRYWIDEPKAQTSSAASHVALAQNEQPKIMEHLLKKEKQWK